MTTQASNRRLNTKLVTAIFFLGVLLALTVPIKGPFNLYDEGFAVLNATRVMSGEAPYKDFWMIYPSGQVYMLAAIFEIFGVNLLTARIYDTLVRFAIVISIYLIAKRLTTHPLALFACMASVVLLGRAAFYSYAVFPALALGLWAIVCLLEFLHTSKKGRLVVSGLLIGVAAVFRWDIGLYTGLSAVLSLSIHRYVYAAWQPKNDVEPMPTLLGSLAVLVGAALPIPIICYGYLGIKGGFDNMWTQVFVFPTITLVNLRRLPYPPIIPLSDSASSDLRIPGNIYLELIRWFQFYFPIVTFAAALVISAITFIKRHAAAYTSSLNILVVSIMGVLLFNQALSRYDALHVLPSLLITFLVAMALVHNFANGQSRIRKRLLLALVTLLATAYFLLPVGTLIYYGLFYSPLGCFSRVERAGCIYLQEDQAQAVEYMRAHTSEDEPIFVGNRQHDRIYYNDMGFYFLANRPAVTKYAELYPGVATTRPVQEIIVRDIELEKVEWIVLVDMPLSSEPNLSSVSSNVSVLDDYIREHYHVAAAFGDYTIMRRLELVR